MSRFLGVDPGAARIGLALSDDDARVALPFDTVKRDKRDKRDETAATQVVAALEAGEVARGDLAGVIVGLPLRLDGTEGEAARRVRRFADALREALAVPLHFVDERLSTVAVERTLRTLNVRKDEQKRVVDQAAAALLLQAFLDARGQETWPEPESDEAAVARDPSRGEQPGLDGRRRAAARPRRKRR
jgi:putative Holliday junction resolvase